MEQRDFIRDQIEQLGRVLGQAIASFLGLKSTGNVSKGIEVANQQLKSELDIDINELLNLSKIELKKYFNNRNFSDEHLEQLAEYFKEIGKSKVDYDKKGAKTHLKKAITLLEIVDETTKTMSFERINKKTEINNVLQQCL